MVLKQKKIKSSQYSNLICGRLPFARAKISGSKKYPDVTGETEFYSTPMGIVVSTEISGLPNGSVDSEERKLYELYIKDEDYEKERISGFHKLSRGSNRFPPLFSNGGFAWSAHLTDRLYLSEIIGKTIIIENNGVHMGNGSIEYLAYGTICSMKNAEL